MQLTDIYRNLETVLLFLSSGHHPGVIAAELAEFSKQTYPGLQDGFRDLLDKAASLRLAKCVSAQVLGVNVDFWCLASDPKEEDTVLHAQVGGI